MMNLVTEAKNTLLSTLTCPQCGYRQTHAIINKNWNDPVSDAKRQ